MRTNETNLVWINGEAYAPNHRKALEAKAAHPQPVARLVRPQPQRQDTPQTLERNLPRPTAGTPGTQHLHCLIVRYGRRKMDSDNLAFSAKQLRDAIAEHLGVDDGSELIEWHYAQVISKTTGTHVIITMT